MALMDEKTACDVAVQELRAVQARLNTILRYMYDSAPGYAGEVESIKEVTENAMRVLSGEPVE